MLFYYFRLSLKPVVQADAFEVRDADNLPYTREGWLRAYFSEPRRFNHWGAPFEFLPLEVELAVTLPQHLVFGWIARPKVVLERTPPAQGFEPTRHESWRGSLVIIDPTEHDDGQKIAMERREDIGEPRAILRSMASQMRVGDGPQPFSAQAFAIVEPSSFWRFAEEHHYQIKWLTFDVAVPNMFGGSDEFESELKRLEARNNVQRVRTTLASDGVLDPKANNLDQVVDYTERGAGRLVAATTTGARYNSANFAKHDQIDSEPEDSDFWSRLALWLQGRF